MFGPITCTVPLDIGQFDPFLAILAQGAVHLELLDKGV